MRYWDSSALVPLFVEQIASERLRQVASADPAVVTSWATLVEAVSALARLERDEMLAPAALRHAVAELRRASGTWTEVTPSNDVREQAIRIVRVHSVRAADAMHIGAALVVAEFQPSQLEFVTLDGRQAAVAEREGFPVIS